MKRVILYFLTILLLLTGCSKQSQTGENAVKKSEFSNGLWISYSEIADMLKSEKGLKYEFPLLIEKSKKLNIDRFFIHVRSHGDSIFKSDYFPLTDTAQSVDYDIFEYMIEICRQNNIEVHAWINPYRISATPKELSALPSNSPARLWLEDSETANDRNVVLQEGIYLNPAGFEVRRLVIDGIKEIIKKYSIDGIHFDDYFYPTTDEQFDFNSYESYKNSTQSPLSLDNWRRANVDALISECKTAIDLSGKDINFSISPAASIEKNYDSFYADVGGWIEKGYMNEVIPQIYFGFEYKDKNFRFEHLLNDWKKLCKKNEKIKLSIGIAPYKIGTASEGDGDEWQKNNDILLRQYKICKSDPNVLGVVYFSASSLFSEELQNTAERLNLENYDLNY